MQIIFAGKAHPADEPGKQLIKKIANLRHDPRFASRIAFVEDYDINVCRHLVQGVDVWLNNPAAHWKPPAPAAKKPCSTGAEPVDPRRVVGRSVRRLQRLLHRQGTSHVDERITDGRDASRSIKCSRRSDSAVLQSRRRRPAAAVDQADDEFHQLAGLAIRRHRMVADYVHSRYLPAAGGLSCDMSVR